MPFNCFISVKFNLFITIRLKCKAMYVYPDHFPTSPTSNGMGTHTYLFSFNWYGCKST